MAKTEAELRKEAVRRRLAAESPEKIGRSLGRSRRWVSKWVGRHDPGSPDWAEGGTRGPKRAANRTPASLEAQVLAVRERLAANPWAQIGAEAIAWELRKLGVEPPPRRTIEQILSRAGAGGRPRRERRKAKGVPYLTAASISFPPLISFRPQGFRSHPDACRRFGASRRRAEKRRREALSVRRLRCSRWR
jgi:hypothetical protein